MRSFLLAGRFLFPLDETRYVDDERWRRAGWWFACWGLLIGIVYVCVLHIGWAWFGEYMQLRLGPMLCVLIADVGWCGYRLMSGAAALDLPTNESRKTGITLPVLIAVVLVVLAKYVLLVLLPIGGKVSVADWRQYLPYVYPQVIDRPLLLMPLWGRWAMMLALSLGRIAPGGSPRLVAMSEGMNLPVILLHWLAATGLTVFYVSGSAIDIPQCFLIALSVLLCAYLTAFFLARRYGGLTQATIAAAGAVAEVVFLAAYLPVASAIYWY